MANQETIVECLQPFCADVAVAASVKSVILRAIEESFDLSGEDTFLLLFYQTDALVSSNWKRDVSIAFFSRSFSALIRAREGGHNTTQIGNL